MVLISCVAALETLLGMAGAPAGEVDLSLPISSKAVERLACDCSVTRVLLGSDSAVIDVRCRWGRCWHSRWESRGRWHRRWRSRYWW